MITEGVTSRDYAVVQGLDPGDCRHLCHREPGGDISYAFLDPRIRLQMTPASGTVP